MINRVNPNTEAANSNSKPPWDLRMWGRKVDNKYQK